jgi:hypothetical protein
MLFVCSRFVWVFAVWCLLLLLLAILRWKKSLPPTCIRALTMTCRLRCEFCFVCLFFFFFFFFCFFFFFNFFFKFFCFPAFNGRVLAIAGAWNVSCELHLSRKACQELGSGDSFASDPASDVELSNELKFQISLFVLWVVSALLQRPGGAQLSLTHFLSYAHSRMRLHQRASPSPNARLFRRLVFFAFSFPFSLSPCSPCPLQSEAPAQRVPRLRQTATSRRAAATQTHTLPTITLPAKKKEVRKLSRPAKTPFFSSPLLHVFVVLASQVAIAETDKSPQALQTTPPIHLDQKEKNPCQTFFFFPPICMLTKECKKRNLKATHERQSDRANFCFRFQSRSILHAPGRH